MRKSRLNHLLQDYVAGDCTDEQAAEVRNLLAEDGKARALYEEMRAAHEALQTLRDRPAPAVSADNALPHIRAAITRDAFRQKPQLFLEGESTRFYRRLAAAALLLFAVSISLLALNRVSGNDGTVVVREPAPSVPPENRPGIELLLGEKPMSAEELLKLHEQLGLDPNYAYTPHFVSISTPLPESR